MDTGQTDTFTDTDGNEYQRTERQEKLKGLLDDLNKSLTPDANGELDTLGYNFAIVGIVASYWGGMTLGEIGDACTVALNEHIKRWE